MAAGTIDLDSGIVQPARADVSFGSGGSVVPTSRALVKSVIWRAGREPSSAEIQFPDLRLEGFNGLGALVDESVSISVKLPSGKSIMIFSGRGCTPFGEYDKNAENVAITALDVRWDLSKDFVMGQERRGQLVTAPGTWAFICFTGYPCIFNEGSKGNKFTGTADGETAGSGLESVFHCDARRRWGTPDGNQITTYEWTLGEMLSYAYRQRLRERRYEFRGLGDPPDPNHVGNPLIDPLDYRGPGTNLVLFDVDVEGQPINEAFDSIFSAGGIRWWTKPTGSGPKAELVGHTKRFEANTSTQHKLFMPSAGSRVLPSQSGAGSPKLPNVKPDHSRAQLKIDHSGVCSAIVATGSRKTIEFEFELRPLWRASDEEAITQATALGAMAEEDKTRQTALRTKLREATASPWPPDLGGDPAAVRLFEVGRIYGIDTTGYERGVDGTEFPWKALDPMTGEPTGAPIFGADVGALHPGPRLFKRILKAASPIGVEGEGKNHSFEAIKPHQIEIYHEDYPKTGGAGAGVTAIPYDGSWELDPERMAIRFLANNIDEVGLFNVFTLKFARRVVMRLSVQADFRYTVGAGDVQGPGEFSPVRAYSNIRSETSYGDQGTDADPGRLLGKQADARYRTNRLPNTSASIMCDWIRFDIEPGHWVTSIDGRGISLRGQVQEVHFDFVDQQTTIVLEDPVMFMSAPPPDPNAGGFPGLERDMDAARNLEAR